MVCSERSEMPMPAMTACLMASLLDICMMTLGVIW